MRYMGLNESYRRDVEVQPNVRKRVRRWKRKYRRAIEALRREQEAREAAERALRRKDRVLASAGHELRTPLNAILAWAQLARYAGADEIPESLAKIEENARLQALLINDIIDAARDASGTLRMDRRTIDIHSVAQAALAVVSPIAAAREIRLDYHPEGDPVCVNGDPVRLQQVIWNLLTNAIKFTPTGGEVALSVRDDGDVARIDVTDTGRGIDPEFLPRIFEAFAQDGEAEGARAAGAGLGLSIARRLVELHEGTIRAASDGPGRGATFTVRLPKALAAATTS